MSDGFPRVSLVFMTPVRHDCEKSFSVPRRIVLGTRAMPEEAAKPLVGIIMGSKSDWDTMRPAAETL